MKLLLAFAAGALVSFLVTSDLYGRVMTQDFAGGIMCRVHGLDAVRTSGRNADPVHFCADLSAAIPEAQLWDAFRARLPLNAGLEDKR